MHTKRVLALALALSLALCACGQPAAPVGWETGKETWARLRADELDICLPPESLLLLEEDAYAG